MAAELFLRLLRRDERARVDVPRSYPAVERDVPHPAGAHRGGGRVRIDALGLDVAGNLHGDRPVAEERIGEGDERLSKRLVDQQPAEAGTIDEEVAVNGAVPLGDDVIDAAVLRELDLVDLVDNLAHPARYPVLLEEIRQELGVELIGIGVLDGVVGEETVLRFAAAAAVVLDSVVENAAVEEPR